LTSERYERYAPVVSAPNRGLARERRKTDMREELELNRAYWDEATRFHTRGNMYGLEDFKAGKCGLHRVELEEVGDVRGKRLLHLIAPGETWPGARSSSRGRTTSILACRPRSLKYH
jgi:hypothetical protein